MSARPIIAIDCDGVLADLVGFLCSALNKKAGAGAPVRTPSQFKTYNLFATLDAEEAKSVNWWAGAMGTATAIPWYAGAQMLVKELQSLGELYAVTAPWKAPTWASERVQWLSPVIDSAHVISCSAEAKPFVCAGADVLIEDRADTLAAWLHTAKPGAAAILVDRPWNRGVEFGALGRHIHRAKSLGEVARLVARKVAT